MQSYFIRESDRAFTPTELVGGAWKEDEQHIAAPIGLLAHLIEQDHAARGGTLTLARLSFDIYGVLPLETVEVDIRVLRPGRTIELVEATLTHRGRAALVVRAWMLQELDTAQIAGTSIEPLPPRDVMQPWDYGRDWAGQFVRSIETFKLEEEPGRAFGWVRPKYPLLEGEAVSDTARIIGVLDTTNGLTPRADTTKVAFPNLDLTVSMFRTPRGEWAGYDTRATFGERGIGLTHSFVHDEQGPFGVVTQTLTVRPM